MYGFYYTSSFRGNRHEYHVKYSNEQYLNIIHTLKVKTTLQWEQFHLDTFLLPYHILENDCLNQVNLYCIKTTKQCTAQYLYLTQENKRMLPQESVFMTHKHKVRISFYVRLLLSLIIWAAVVVNFKALLRCPLCTSHFEVIPLKRMFYPQFRTGSRILEKCI